MRTFIAIDLSDDNKAELARLQEELKIAQADVKWVEPENIHLTLKFLGEISKEQVAQVKQTLDKVVLAFKPFEISLSGLGAFPKLDYPRVIWIGIEKGKKETEEIAKKIGDELDKQGFQKEERGFSAHLTIGRVRSSKNKEALKNKLNELNELNKLNNSQLVSSMILYQSTLTPQGPIYTPLHSATFPKSS